MIYSTQGTYLRYNYEAHEQLEDMMQVLENNQLIKEITYNNVKRYVMSEELVAYLKKPS